MAEPLSTIASVLAVGTLAVQSSKALYELVDTIIQAPKEISAISGDAQGLHAIVLSLQSQLLEQDIQYVIQEDTQMLEMLENLKHPLTSCSKTLIQLTLKLEGHLKHSDDGKGFRFSSIDFTWWLTRSKFKDLMDRLGQNKGTLNMALAAITVLCSVRLNARLQAIYNQNPNDESTATTAVDPVLSSLRPRRKSTDTDAGSALREYANGISALESMSLSSSLLEPPGSTAAASLTETWADHGRPQTPPSPAPILHRLRREENQRTGLHRAAKDGEDLTVEILLIEGAYVDAKDPEGKTALHMAASLGKEAVVRTLLKYGADVGAKTIPGGSVSNRKHCGGRTPLHWAAANGYEGIVQLLLENKADVAVVNTTQRTPLIEAVMYGHTAIAKTLIEAGAPINLQNREGWTPLHQAANEGDLEITKLLLDRGADPELLTFPADNRKEFYAGRTPLLIAAEKKGNRLVLHELLIRKVNIEARSTNGYTALHLAALAGDHVLVRMLLEAGVEIDPRDSLSEDTPLHKAASKGQIAAIRVLLQKGADVRAINNLGRTPAEHARECGHEEAQRIAEYSADLHS